MGVDTCWEPLKKWSIFTGPKVSVANAKKPLSFQTTHTIHIHTHTHTYDLVFGTVHSKSKPVVCIRYTVYGVRFLCVCRSSLLARKKITKITLQLI
jgi:hypothetical protein